MGKVILLMDRKNATSVGVVVYVDAAVICDATAFDVASVCAVVVSCVTASVVAAIVTL